jgi:DNA primase
VAYISSILESFLGDIRKHNEGTGQISFDCPACSADKGMPEGDGKGNLEINYHKDVFKCWVCKDTHNMSGSVVKLIKKYGNNKHLKDYKLFKPEASLSNEDRRHVELKLPVGYKALSTATSHDFKYNLAIKYLYKRGITDEMIKKFNIGYTTKGTYFNRIIIPSYDEDGMLNYFVGRWFDKQFNRLKYLNPDVEKQEVIFNEGLVNWDATLYLVEGVTDHIVVPNSIPMLGKYISPLLLEKIYEKAKANVIIFLDGDAFEDAKRLYNQLNFGDLNGRIRIVLVPEKYDPSLINQKWGKRGIIKVIRNAKTLDEIEKLLY